MKLPSKRVARGITERVAEVVAEAADGGGVPPDTCVLQSRLAQLVLARLGVPATPIPVSILVTRPDGSWVRVGTGRTDNPDIWPAHLILRVRSAYLLDMTPRQTGVSGLPRWILTEWRDDLVYGVGGNRAEYTKLDDHSYVEGAPGERSLWRDLARDPLIDRLVERVD